MSEDAKFYGHLKSGEAVYEYTLNSASGISVKALNYGGIITAINVPVDNAPRNIVLALDSLEAYESNPNYIGVLIGRYGGRLQTPVEVNGLSYHLSANDRGNCLHGGTEGFGKKIWQAQVCREDDAETLHLKYQSRAGEEGFPGELTVHVSYRLWQDGHLQIVYRAISDTDTPVSLTHHSYFNLSGGKDTVLNHKLVVDADRMQLTGEHQTPLNEWYDISTHPMTSQEGQSITAIHRWIHETFQDDKGLDYSFAQRPGAKHLLIHEESQLKMRVQTDYSSVVIYAGGWLNEAVPFTVEEAKRPFSGICFETQCMPNGPNLMASHEGVLAKGELYHHSTTFWFENLRDTK